MRVEFAGALYHVTARGDRREPIYEDQTDRELFLGLLGKVVEALNWLCYAYCLMSTHYHLLIETSEELKHQTYLGDERFVERMQAQAKAISDDVNIPKVQRWGPVAALPQIEPAHDSRAEAFVGICDRCIQLPANRNTLRRTLHNRWPIRARSEASEAA